MNRFYTIDDVGTMKFFQMPKDLYHNPKYKNINSNTKVAYMILRDRQDLSIKNKWVDDNGNIFFYFDCQNLADIMNVSTSTVNQCKKSLKNESLLYEKRQGQGKPNKMYILKPEHVDLTLISDSDISSVANLNELDKRKSLGIDTELNETERKKLNINMVYLSETTYMFLNLFKEYFRYEHRKVKSEPDYSHLDMDKAEFEEMVIEYFDIYSTGIKKTDLEKCSINNVIQSANRYVIEGGWQ